MGGARRRRVSQVLKLQITAGQATPAPPVGPALGQAGVNIMEFCKQYNAATQQQTGTIVPVEITVYEDRSFTFVTKTPPAAVLLREKAGVEKGSSEPPGAWASRSADRQRLQLVGGGIFRRGPRGGAGIMAGRGKRYGSALE